MISKPSYCELIPKPRNKDGCDKEGHLALKNALGCITDDGCNVLVAVVCLQSHPRHTGIKNHLCFDSHIL